MLEAIYARIEGVTDRVYPDYPATNTDPEYVVYRQTSSEPQLNLKGPSTLTKLTVQIDTHAETFAGVATLQASINTQLHGWRDVEDGVQGCFLATQSTEESDDESFRGVQVFTVWSTET